MGKRLALLAIRLLVSANLLYAAIFLKFAGVPGSVALFKQMSQAVHGDSAPDSEDSQDWQRD
jgi:hypothetical protein